MHGTTKASIEPGSPSKDFCQGSIEKKIPSQIFYAASRGFLFYDPQAVSTEKVFHHCLQSGIVDFTNSGCSLGENLPMRAVRTEDMVVRPQQKSLTDGCGFLPDGQVRGALVIVFDSLIDSLRLDLLQHVLKLTDKKHILINTNESFGSVAFQLILNGSGILVKRNIRTGQFPCFAFLLRFDDLRLRHNSNGCSKIKVN